MHFSSVSVLLLYSLVICSFIHVTAQQHSGKHILQLCIVKTRFALFLSTFCLVKMLIIKNRKKYFILIIVMKILYPFSSVSFYCYISFCDFIYIFTYHLKHL